MCFRQILAEYAFDTAEDRVQIRYIVVKNLCVRQIYIS